MRVLLAIRSIVAIGILIAIAVLAAQQASLAVTMVQTGGGSDRGDKKPDWVELDRFVIKPEIVIPKGESAPRSGKAGPGSLSITKLMDKSGAALGKFCCQGGDKKAEIRFATSNKDTEGMWLFFTLSSVELRAYKIEPLPAAGDVEKYTFDYRALKWTWSEQPPKKSEADQKDKWSIPSDETPRADQSAREAASEAVKTGVVLVPRVTPKPVVQGPMTGVVSPAPQTPESSGRTAPPMDPTMIEPPMTEPTPQGPSPTPSPVPPGPM